MIGPCSLFLGFLFFGTITQVEETIRQLVEPEAWIHNPVRFLVIDFSLVAGVDMSSAEAFVRIHRLLTGKNVTMVLCGLPSESTVETSLQSVGLFDADFVEVFAPHVLEAEDMDATTRATLINDYIQVKVFAPKFSTSGQL